MNFIVSTSSLLKNLQSIYGVVSTNSVLPILEDFLFEIKNGNLTVSATDLETSMITELKVESKDNGKIAIPARILMDTLKTLPEQPLSFRIDKNNFSVEISTETGRYKLSGENPEDFPKIPVPDGVTEIQMPAAVISYAIGHTLFAVSTDDLRPAMTGVLFQLAPEGITFVSTDAHKLVKLTRTDVKAAKAAQFIVPKKALNLLKGSLPDNETAVNIGYNKNNAFFRFENTKLVCRLIDATYPDYNAVIPYNNPNKLTVNRLEFLNALRRVSIYANKTTHQVVLSIAGNTLKISAQDLDFSNEASEQLNCSYDGKDMDIGFNARFMIEMLGVIPSVEIDLEMSSPSRPGVLRPVEKQENEDMLMLMMPVMINA
ncbi:MAG: DNA polymerase III subunit beta [Chitinophagales bacterium]|nr:DNA polymerase III subunit beta [Chitinophagales bacterium]MDW8420080.1 DNA polymerase III subunit beta [Chitinophagales bacterium]